MYSCSYCEYLFNSLNLYLKHLKHYHLLSNGDNIKCSKHCSQVYKSFQGLKYHMNLYHKTETNLNNIASTNKPEILLNDIASAVASNLTAQSEIVKSDEPDRLHKLDSFQEPLDIKKYINDFTLFLYRLHLPESYIQQIVHMNNFCTNSILDRVKLLVSDEIFLKEFSSLNISDASTYKFRKNIFLQCNLVKPKDIQIGYRIESKYDKLLKHYVQKSCPITMTYTPILKQLQFLLNNETVAQYISMHHFSEEGYIGCYEDGEKFKSHPLFSKEISIRINLYYDDFDVCNGIGSKATIHKIGAIYFTLDNLPRNLNSKLQNINVALLFHWQDIKMVSFNTILKPLVDDLKILEQRGIDVNWSERPIRGTLSLYSGDNLGSNSILGYVECFTANYFCRICLASKNDTYVMLKEDESLLRTTVTHSEHLASSQNNPHATHTFGVKNNSMLNELEYFNVADNNSVDIMHDTLEGIVQIELKMVFKKLIASQLLTEDIITYRIHSFDYGTNESSNKPVSFNLNKSGQDLGLSACQSWCLIRHILFMMDIIEPDNNYLKLIILLVQIMHIIFAPKLAVCMTYELETLVSIHHKLFLQLFPENHLLPKHHFMIHYGRIIRQYGNLINFYCMRYEAKHYTFVKLANRVQNFKNITNTLSTRHQLDLAYSYISKNHDAINLISEYYSPARKLDINLMNLNQDTKHHLRSYQSVQTHKWIKLNGVKHSIGNFIYLGSDTGELVFGRIQHIINLQDTIMFYVDIFCAQGISYRYQAHALTNMFRQKLVPAFEIRDYQSFQSKYSLAKRDRNEYICTKHVLL